MVPSPHSRGVTRATRHSQDGVVGHDKLVLSDVAPPPVWTMHMTAGGVIVDGMGPTSVPRLRVLSHRRHLGTRRRVGRPSGPLAEHWTTVGGVEVFYRESIPSPDAPVMMHLHGFGLSGRYLVPTAERLAGEFHTLVPDLPGFGRSGRSLHPLDVPDLAAAAAAFLDDRELKSATLVGNSMGCPVICEFARQNPDRIDRAILVSPAGGLHNQPLQRAISQLARDGVREPTALMSVAVPDYLRFGVPSTLRLFRALTQFPALERLLQLEVPTLVVVGDRDPLMPSPARIREIANQYDALAALVVIEGAAHAINFSHPGELANVIRLFMADEPIVDDENSPGRARAYEFHRGARLPHRDAQDRGPSVEKGLQEQHEGAGGAREQALQAEGPPPQPDAIPGDEADPGEEQDRRPESG
jgi:pimeloyl-ACP methyl ester carboxylesterase